MAKYKVLAGPVLDVRAGRTVTIDVDNTDLNVIALIQAGHLAPADATARAHYDRWFWNGDPPAEPDSSKKDG